MITNKAIKSVIAFTALNSIFVNLVRDLSIGTQYSAPSADFRCGIWRIGKMLML